jgi:hypothetical protein
VREREERRQGQQLPRGHTPQNSAVLWRGGIDARRRQSSRWRQLVDPMRARFLLQKQKAVIEFWRQIQLDALKITVLGWKTTFAPLFGPRGVKSNSLVQITFIVALGFASCHKKSDLHLRITFLPSQCQLSGQK